MYIVFFTLARGDEKRIFGRRALLEADLPLYVLVFKGLEFAKLLSGTKHGNKKNIAKPIYCDENIFFI